MKNFALKSYVWLKNASFNIFHSRLGWLAISLICITIAISMVLIAVFSISGAIVKTTEDNIISAEDAAALEDVDCIIVLGAGLKSDGSPSDMLTDRLLTGIELVENGADAKLLLSGDNSGAYYNEVGAMLAFVSDKGIAEERVLLDNEGFSTFESICRAVEEFGAKKVIIVTQGYHLHRALYIARQFRLEAYGVSADLRSYRGQLYRDVREHLARVKDFYKCLVECSNTK